MGRDYTQVLPVERLGPSDVDIWGDGGALGTEICYLMCVQSEKAGVL